MIPANKVAWNYEEGDNGLFSASGAVVLTVAGDSEALPGTENGSAKVTPLEMYPTKGRGTGGVRSQRFLKGQDTLILASWAHIRYMLPRRAVPAWNCRSRICVVTVLVRNFPRQSPSSADPLQCDVPAFCEVWNRLGFRS